MNLRKSKSWMTALERKKVETNKQNETVPDIPRQHPNKNQEYILIKDANVENRASCKKSKNGQSSYESGSGSPERIRYYIQQYYTQSFHTKLYTLGYLAFQLLFTSPSYKLSIKIYELLYHTLTHISLNIQNTRPLIFAVIAKF